MLRSPIAHLSPICRDFHQEDLARAGNGGADRGGVGGAGDAGGGGDGQQVHPGGEARGGGAVAAAAEAAVRHMQRDGKGGVPVLPVVRRGRLRLPDLRGHPEDALPELRRVRDRAPGARADRHRLRHATPATGEHAVIGPARDPRPCGSILFSRVRNSICNTML